MSDQDRHGNEHLDEMTCLLYVEGQLDHARAQEVSSHTEHCPGCRTLLHALERESRLLKRAMFEDEEPLPARLAVVPGRSARSLQWVWAVAFGLAATGVYALYTGYIEPWMQQLEQAGFGGTNLLGLLIFQGAFWKGWQSMLSLLEVLAMLTLGGFLVVLLRRRLRRGSALAIVLGGLCAAVMLPAQASAADLRRGETVMVGKDEVIHNDLYVTGRRVRMDGKVEGDLIAFTSELDMNGHVTGDVICFCNSVHVPGQVDGNVRSFSNNTTVSGVVGHNVTTFSGMFSLESGGKINGGLTAFAGGLSLDGRVGRDVLGHCGGTTISGVIGGGLRLQGSELNIMSSAQIKGPAKFRGEKEPSVSPEAKLAGGINYEKWHHGPNYGEAHFYIWYVIYVAAVVLFGLVLFLLMPRFAADSVAAGESFGISLGLGVLVFFAVPIAACVACFTVVGLALGISTFLLWFGTLFCSQLVVGGILGKWILGPTRETWPLIGRMALGYVLIRMMVAVPKIGMWVWFGVVLWGFGAISLALYRRFQPAMPAPSSASAVGMQPA